MNLCGKTDAGLAHGWLKYPRVDIKLLPSAISLSQPTARGKPRPRLLGTTAAQPQPVQPTWT